MENKLEMNELTEATSITLLQRIVNIFSDPKKVYESLKNKPKFFGVYLISLLITSATLIWNYMDGTSEKVLIDSLVQSGQPITDEVVTLGTLIGLLGGIFMFAVVPFLGAFFYHVLVMINSETGYKKTLSITVHASLISSLNALICLFVLKLSGITLQFSPAMFIDSTALSPVLYTLISFINIFVFWRIAVLYIGFRTTHNLSKKGAWMTAIVPDLVLYAIALITVSITL